jgi:hypothetical protein
MPAHVLIKVSHRISSLPVVKVNLASVFGGSRSKRSMAGEADDDPWAESGNGGGFFGEDEMKVGATRSKSEFIFFVRSCFVRKSCFVRNVVVRLLLC